MPTTNPYTQKDILDVATLISEGIEYSRKDKQQPTKTTKTTKVDQTAVQSSNSQPVDDKDLLDVATLISEAIKHSSKDNQQQSTPKGEQQTAVQSSYTDLMEAVTLISDGIEYSRKDRKLSEAEINDRPWLDPHNELWQNEGDLMNRALESDLKNLHEGLKNIKFDPKPLNELMKNIGDSIPQQSPDFAYSGQQLADAPAQVTTMSPQPPASVRLGPAPAPASTGVCGATAIRAFTILWENVLNNWKTKYASEIATGNTRSRKASYIEFALSELNRDGIHGDKYIADVKTKAQVYEDYGLFDNSSIVVDLSKIIPKWFSSQVAGSVRPEERAKLLHEHLTNIFRMTDTLTPGNISIVSSIINLFISFRLFDDVAIRSFANKATPSFGTEGATSSGASSFSRRLVESEEKSSIS